jgi:hypothetical protein
VYVAIIVFININTNITTILLWEKRLTEIQILSTLKLYDIKLRLLHGRCVLLLIMNNIKIIKNDVYNLRSTFVIKVAHNTSSYGFIYG